MSLKRLNTNGVIDLSKRQTVKLGGNVNAYTRPTRALLSFDRLVNGAQPKILITRKQGGIGDVLMTLPTVKAIQKKYNAIIDYGTDFNYLDGALVKVLQGNPYINKVIEWNKAIHEEYNLCIDLTCPCVAYEKPLVPPVNRIDLFARYVGINIQDYNIDYFISEKEKIWAREFFEETKLINYKTILLQPSSSTTDRDCPIDKIKKSLSKVMQIDKNIRVIVIGHYTDNNKIEWGSLPGFFPIKDFDIREIGAIMDKVDLVICPDSSILHLAAAQHKKTLTLFGPTDPRARINYHPEAVALWAVHGLQNYPCLTEDALIKTKSEYKQIKDILPGEYVKTSSIDPINNQYHKVLQVHKNSLGLRKLYELKVFGSIHNPIKATEDHKFLVSKKVRVSRTRSKDPITGKYLSKKKEECKETYKMLSPEWVETQYLTTDHYFCIPRNKKHLSDPMFDTPEFSPEACWIYGLYLAEGYLKNASCGAKQIYLSGNINEKHIDHKLETCLMSAFNIKHYQIEKINRKKNKNCLDNKISINRIITNKKLFLIMEKLFGCNTTAHTKKIPSIFYNLPDNCIQALLDGMMAGDGYSYTKKNTTINIYTTVSESLAYGFQELYSRFGRLAKVYKYIRDTNFKKNTYIFRVCFPSNPKYSRYITDNNYIYVPLIENKILNSFKTDYVYDLTVENDTTFTVNNLATWDCWYNSPNDGYLCWKRLRENVIIQTTLALINNQPIIDDPEILTFGNYKKIKMLGELL